MALACTGKGSGASWLHACNAYTDCADGLDLCVCGTCTRGCVAAGCSELGTSAMCVTPEPLTSQARCGGAGVGTICAAVCSVDSDCAPAGPGLHCIGGACLVGAPLCHADSDCPVPGPSNVGWGCQFSYTMYRLRCGPVTPSRACSDDVECGTGNVCQGNAQVTDAGSDAESRVCIRAISCAQDAECSDGRVCRSFESFVPTAEQAATELVCRAPCTTDPDCAPTDRCDSSGHCQPRTCAECPSYFSCATRACVVPNCSADKDCPGGFCVNGVCAGALGVCYPRCS